MQTENVNQKHELKMQVEHATKSCKLKMKLPANESIFIGRKSFAPMEMKTLSTFTFPLAN